MSKAHAEVGFYKGAPIITVFTGEKYTHEPIKVVMGIKKARAVDDCIDAIRVFVDHQSNIGMTKKSTREEDVAL